MPFIQRLVQPVNVSQPLLKTSKTDYVLNNNNKIHCKYGKCQNNDDISQCQPSLQTPTHTPAATPIPKHTHLNQQQQSYERKTVNFDDGKRVIDAVQCATELTPTNSLSVLNVKDDVQTSTHTSLLANAYCTTTVDAITPTNTPTLSNRISHDFVADFQHHTSSPISPMSITPMKKLKQHVEFSSTVPSSLRKKLPNLSPAATNVQSKISNTKTSADAAYGCRRFTGISSSSAAGNFNRIIAGYEFDSISNLTLTNAMRQLASLVQIANDMFDDLQWELHFVGVHARALQKKITVIERCVSAFNPKEVRVPESDLLTFAQLKTHYECDKTFTKELFTADTRPTSLRILYREAGNQHQLRMTAGNRNEMSTQTSGDAANNAFVVSVMDDMKSPSVSSNRMLHSPIFGLKQRKMHKRIDTEIEIRMPAVMEVLRKWTSTEALGDVTVTPDCMHHIDSSANDSTYPANSADVLDANYLLNTPNRHNRMAGEALVRDVPLNHRLPSPEEQCKIIALRYPAEIITVDTSGKRFERMSMARRTITTSTCFTGMTANTNSLNDGVQTLHRRSRSRKGRKGHKRRNTLAGIDHNEIQIAANREESNMPVASLTVDAGGQRNIEINPTNDFKSPEMNRSKSNDVLKKDFIAMPYDKGKSTLIRLNSLKLWGRNRFKLMQRSNENNAATTAAVDSKMNNNCSLGDINITVNPQSIESIQAVPKMLMAAGNQSRKALEKDVNTNDFSPMPKLLDKRKYKCQFLYGMERKAACNAPLSSDNVKLRDSSSLNRSRRNAALNANDLLGKDEQPHSSSGNWSASSESGRASIGSEITLQPKSCASSTSLNVSNYHGSSGPSSSMLCRKKFLNTSASSCMTSDGNTTPEIQTACQAMECIYPCGMDDETSSAYSCDTEGYYTSFHMDSGLRTLKEEEASAMIVQYDSQLSDMNCLSSGHTTISNNSQLMLMAENEYELFGRGSTSTTTSSAGTVCTTLMNSTFFMDKNSSSDNNETSAGLAPKLPERVSSLNTNINHNDVLERSVSNSTINSTNGDGTGTIKRNINIPNEDDIYSKCNEKSTDKIRNQSNETEYSECSDLEGMDDVERFKSKTALTVKRIPSMCVITPTTSEENVHAIDDRTNAEDQKTDKGPQLSQESHCLANDVYSSQFPSLQKSEANHLPFAAALTNCDSEGDIAGEYVYLTPINVGLKQHPGQLNPPDNNFSIENNTDTDSKLRGSSSITPEIDVTSSYCTKSTQRSPRKSSSSQSIENRIYDANSLKRYKGSHSTFITGPYIRLENRSEQALKAVDSFDSNIESMSPLAKTLLLNGGIAGPRRNASVRPITTTSMVMKNAWNSKESLSDALTSQIADSGTKKVVPNSPKDSQYIQGGVVRETSLESSTKDSDAGMLEHNDSEGEQHLKDTTAVSICKSVCGSNDDLKQLPGVDKQRPMNVNDFLTSTPIRRNDGMSNSSQHFSNKSPSMEYFNSSDSWARDRLNTCADRIGHTKTTLMDFKKLLLSKSSKASILQKRISAVELLKKTNPKNMETNENQEQQQHESSYKSNIPPQLNNSLKLLNLSGSPKTYTYRKFSRQNQYASPLKRTNIMSTIIPEVSSEEDQLSNGLLAYKGSNSETNGLTKASSGSIPATSTDSLDLQSKENSPSSSNSFVSRSNNSKDISVLTKARDIQTELNMNKTEQENIEIITKLPDGHSDGFNGNSLDAGGSTTYSSALETAL